MLLLRNDVEARVLRLPGQLYEHKEDNIISNVFTYKVVNKTTKKLRMSILNLRKYRGTIKLVSTDKVLVVPAQGLAEGTLFIEIDQSDLKR